MSSSSHASGSPQGQGPDGALSDPETRQRFQRFPQLRLCGLLLVSGHDGEEGRECGNGVTATQAYDLDLHRFLPLPGVFTYYDDCNLTQCILNYFIYLRS